MPNDEHKAQTQMVQAPPAGQSAAAGQRKRDRFAMVFLGLIVAAILFRGGAAIVGGMQNWWDSWGREAGAHAGMASGVADYA